jgi:hypothetical protein
MRLKPVRLHQHIPVIVMAVMAAHAQERGPAQPEPPTVIRAESRLVLVDAVVTDKKGKPIRDLGAGDFRLWEDAQERKIANVSLETAARSPGRGRMSYILLFFDGSTVSPAGIAALRRDATRFVDASASPDRYMAVAYFTNALRVAQNFTAMPEPLKRAIAAVPAIGGVTAALPVSSIRPYGYGTPGADAVYTQSVLFPSLRTAVESMGSIRGRKALVLFSGGFPRTANTDSDVAATAAACNRANVVVYVIDSGSVLKPLADQTGGRLIAAAGDLIRELGKVVDEQEEYYLLGYVPPETPEGSCHALRVRVDRAGADVRARTAYCSVKPPDLLAGRAVGKAVEERAASPSEGNMAASLELPYFYRGPNLARVVAAMEIMPSGVRFQKVKGKAHAELNLVGVAYQDGAVAARFSDTVNLDFDSDKEAAVFAKRPYHYENQFDLGAGRYVFRMAFTAGGDNFGKVEMPLVIEPWDSTTLALSALVIAAGTRQVPDLAAGLDDAFLEDRRPLRAGSLEITPSGNHRCSRASRCQAFIEVYEPLLAGPKPPTVALRVRILDRRTGEQKLDSGPFGVTPYVRPGNPVTPVPLTLPVAGMAAGSYRIEVTALHSSGTDYVVRTADLEVD